MEDSKMTGLIGCLNDLRQIKWRILAQAQKFDNDIEVLNDIITSILIELHENYGEAWLKYDPESKRERNESIRFPRVLLESRRFEIDPKPAA